ncbi:MAG TPA: GtrA family protein [Dehalococcoidia bacterium]|nr:GtrA family protein [Dehalococcoidia bacterium]
MTSDVKLSSVPAFLPFSERMTPEFWQFLKYAAIGVFNGIVDLAVLGILVWIFNPQRDISVVAVNTTSFLTASLISFYMHSRFTFQRPVPFFSRWFALFCLLNLGNLILSNTSLLIFRWLLGETLGIEGRAAILLAKVLTAGVLVGYGWFTLRRLFSSTSLESPTQFKAELA